MKIIATAGSGILRNIVDTICAGQMQNPLSEAEFFQFLVWLTEQEELTCVYNSTSSETVRTEFEKLGFVTGQGYQWILDQHHQPMLATGPDPALVPSIFELSVESPQNAATLTSLAEGSAFDFGIREKLQQFRGVQNRIKLDTRKKLRLKVGNYMAGMGYTPHVGDVVRVREEFFHVVPQWLRLADLMVLAIGDGWLEDRTKGKIHLDNNIGVAFLNEEGQLQMCPMNSTMVELCSAAQAEGAVADWLDDNKRAEIIRTQGRVTHLNSADRYQ